MPRKPGKVPSYCLHKASGNAVVRIDGRDHYLGPYGSQSSYELYERKIAHLPDKHHDELRRQLNLAYHHADHRQAVKSLGTTVAWLRRLNPDAAASLAEGLEETLTVVRLGVPELLRKTLSTTNPIESAFSVAEAATRRVKRWRDGDMRQRWCVAGLLDAERHFNRVKGYRHLKQLLDALQHDLDGPTLDAQRKRA